MNAYKVTLNGKVYEFTIELINKDDIKAAPAAPAAPVAAPAAPAPAPAAAGDKAVKSPMPGTILDVKVQAGQAVKAGQLLMVLEAMKMENEILAAADGTVAAVNVTKGATVDTGTVLCTMA